LVDDKFNFELISLISFIYKNQSNNKKAIIISSNSKLVQVKEVSESFY